jgi:hypothetical protein
MQKFDIVRRTDGSSLRSGCEEYKYAIVASISPFILSSQDGTMLWKFVKPEDFYVVGFLDESARNPTENRFKQKTKAEQNSPNMYRALIRVISCARESDHLELNIIVPSWNHLEVLELKIPYDTEIGHFLHEEFMIRDVTRIFGKVSLGAEKKSDMVIDVESLSIS